MPPALSDVRMLTTTSIASNGGSGSNESTIYVGNFSNLMIGMRNDIRIEIARERFTDNHQYGFYAHMRFDVAVAHVIWIIAKRKAPALWQGRGWGR